MVYQRGNYDQGLPKTDQGLKLTLKFELGSLSQSETECEIRSKNVPINSLF